MMKRNAEVRTASSVANRRAAAGLAAGLAAVMLLMTACGSNGTTTTAATTAAAKTSEAAATTAAETKAGKTTAAAETTAASAEKTFTVDELATYNGKDGQPSYIAVDGVVYDVSSVPQWKNGQHEGYSAGKDLTSFFGESPHGKDILTKLNPPVVGKLAQ